MAVIRPPQLPGTVLPGNGCIPRPLYHAALHPGPGFPNIWHNLWLIPNLRTAQTPKCVTSRWISLFSVVVPWANRGEKSAKYGPHVHPVMHVGVFYLQHKSSCIFSWSRLYVKERILQLVFGETIPGLDMFLKLCPNPGNMIPKTAARRYLLAQMAPAVLYGTG